MNTGPPNLVVSLHTDTGAPYDTDLAISRTKTTVDGSFVLSSVSPDNYVIVVSDSESIAGQENIRISSKITVSTNSLNIEKPFILQVRPLYIISVIMFFLSFNDLITCVFIRVMRLFRK